MSSIPQRKTEHLALCREEEVGFRQVTTLLECVRLVHNALPECAMEEISLETTLFGKRLRAPLLIAAMTGGSDEAGEVNQALSEVAETRGIAFGLGSQRAMHAHPTLAPSYLVRSRAKQTVILGNLGLVQARAMTDAEVAALCEKAEVDALCIHLNPAMELVQPHGDRDFRGGEALLSRLAEALPVPVVVKETGSGLGPDVASRIRSLGIRHVDVSGAGGTSWVGVETKRAAAHAETAGVLLGEALWDWGIPTAASVSLVSRVGFDTVIATGGISTGHDVARALALGAHVVGIARPVLKALAEGGPARVHAFLDQIELELRAIMLLTGCLRPHDLQKAPRVLVGELRRWISDLCAS